MAQHLPMPHLQGDSIPVDQLPGLLRSLLAALSSEQELAIRHLHDQIIELQQFITLAHEEIASIHPANMRDVEIPEAQDELSAVVAATEEATHVILDSVEGLERLSAGLPAESEEHWNALIVRIYEASNFQDITGQRISKVVNTLRGIELRVSKLAAHFPGSALDITEITGGPGLLNGPQLPETAVSQDEVDAMFD